MNFSVIVPAHNESENLKPLIPRLDKSLSALGVEYEIIVVDNASTDNTQAVLESLKIKFPRLNPIFEGKKGFGNALHAGFEFAKGDVIGYIHADNQMEPDDLIKIYKKLVADHLEVCKATRLDRHDGITRWIISKVYNLLFRLMFRVRLRDINGSPKLFTREFYNKARLESRDWFIDPEIVIKAKRLNMKMGELEIHTLAREHGSSQVRAQAIIEFLKHMFYYWQQR